MKDANNVEIIINNNKYKVKGYESDEYFHRVASLVNSKYKEIKNNASYKLTDERTKATIVQINLADDYLKVQEKLSEMEAEIAEKNQEIFDLKHDIISLKSQIDANKRKQKIQEQEKKDSER